MSPDELGLPRREESNENRNFQNKILTRNYEAHN
jgi:hypothetical protein